MLVKILTFTVQSQSYHWTEIDEKTLDNFFQISGQRDGIYKFETGDVIAHAVEGRFLSYPSPDFTNFQNQIGPALVNKYPCLKSIYWSLDFDVFYNCSEILLALNYYNTDADDCFYLSPTAKAIPIIEAWAKKYITNELPQKLKNFYDEWDLCDAADKALYDKLREIEDSFWI